MTRLAAACLFVAAAAGGQDDYTYWIQPCTKDVSAASRCDETDSDLARWALEAWQRAAGSGLHFTPATREYDARIRFYWLGKKPQLYGDTRLLFVEGKRGAAIEVHPDLSQYGAEMEKAGRDDRLFRDTVVYLTCLHEAGHAIGLPHTADFADIMYSFQFGGNVSEYFRRYRKELKARSDIRKHSGISAADRERAAQLYAVP